MKVTNNRAFVPITVTGPSGKQRTVWFWVDTGGGIIALSGRLVKTLGLTSTGHLIGGIGNAAAEEISSARLSIGGLALGLNGVGIVAHLSPPSRTAFAEVESDGFLPARVLSSYDVVFDYPHRTFSIGKAGSMTHQGVAVPLSVERTSGFARVSFAVDRSTYGFMVDTGAAYSGLSEALVAELHTAHPSWPFQAGAIGPANMVGKQFDVESELLIVPQVCLPPLCIRDAGFVSRPTGVYEKTVSREMSAPIVGVVGGNVLSQFRLELDYPHQTAYLKRTGPGPRAAITAVGIIVGVQENGAIEISGTAKQDGAPEVRGLVLGDRLLQVDGRSVTGLPLSTLLQLLSGKVGEHRSLTILRNGRSVVITAPVLKHLAR